jgi:hypothetical protein
MRIFGGTGSVSLRRIGDQLRGFFGVFWPVLCDSVTFFDRFGADFDRRSKEWRGRETTPKLAEGRDWNREWTRMNANKSSGGGRYEPGFGRAWGDVLLASWGWE